MMRNAEQNEKPGNGQFQINQFTVFPDNQFDYRR